MDSASICPDYEKWAAVGSGFELDGMSRWDGRVDGKATRYIEQGEARRVQEIVPDSPRVL